MSDPTTTPPPAHPVHPADHSHGPGGGHHDHVVPMWLLVAVIVALMILTVITVGVAMITPNVPLAVFIATIKAGLVATFFMHLWWDKPFNTVILLISVGLLGLFLWFASLDTGQYQPSVNAGYAAEHMRSMQDAWRAEHGGGEHDEGGQGH